MKAHQIIKRPVLTEKGTHLKETGGMPAGLSDDEIRSKVIFEVTRDANKVQVRKAVEELFSVKVVAVHTQIVRGKERRVGRFTGRRSAWKRAIVTLSAGSKIEFFEGV